MATSVWISGSRSPVSRALALTMPAVTVLSKPKGEPMAMTHSPTLSLPTSPIRSSGRLLASIFSTATSVRRSRPTTLALNSRLSVSVTMTSSASSTTWALVITKPSAPITKPEPRPRRCGASSSSSSSGAGAGAAPGGVRRCGGTGMPKRRSSSRICSSTCGFAALTFSEVRMLTTAGPACSTRALKSGSARARSGVATGTAAGGAGFVVVWALTPSDPLIRAALAIARARREGVRERSELGMNTRRWRCRVERLTSCPHFETGMSQPRARNR